MARIAEFTVPSEAFPLGTLLEAIPGATMELDRIVPTRNAIIPYVWVRDGDAADIERAVRGHPDLDAMRIVDRVDDVVLYRVEWQSEMEGILACIVGTDVSLVSGTGTDGRWVFEVRADSADAIAAFQGCCEDSGIPITLSRLHSLAEVDTRGRYNLTPEQLEALVLAFEEGYYEEPSETTLAELAVRLDISPSSMSARLKRGYRNLVGSTLMHHQSGRE